MRRHVSQNKASALDMFDQMMRMRTTMIPSHLRVKVSLASKHVGDGILQGMKEWHDKYVAFRSMHQLTQLQQGRCARSDLLTKKTPSDRQNGTNQIQATAVFLLGCGSTAQPQIETVDVGALTQAAAGYGYGYISSPEVSSGTVAFRQMVDDVVLKQVDFFHVKPHVKTSRHGGQQRRACTNGSQRCSSSPCICSQH